MKQLWQLFALCAVNSSSLFATTLAIDNSRNNTYTITIKAYTASESIPTKTIKPWETTNLTAPDCFNRIIASIHLIAPTNTKHGPTLIFEQACYKPEIQAINFAMNANGNLSVNYYENGNLKKSASLTKAEAEKAGVRNL